MGGDADNVIKVMETVFDEYLPRFDNLVWDTRFIALAIPAVDLKKLFRDIDETTREAYFKAIGRFTQDGLEGYTIFKFSITFYWAEVESFIDAFLKNWLTHAKPPATLEVFEKINFTQSVREFENLSRSEVMTLYVQGLKDKVRAGSEIKTFFAALDKVGLGRCDGEQKKRLERTFTELQQVRNIMVHKSGIVDRRMIMTCPWLKPRPDVEVGKLYPLNIEVVQDYGYQILDLAQHIINRIDRYNSDTRPDE